MKNSLLIFIALFWSVNSVMAQSPANCLNFDGQDDFVPLTNQIVLPNEFTLEAWIKTAVDGTILFGSDTALNQSFLFGIDGAKLRFQMNSNIAYLSFTSYPIIIADNNWHHVALTKNASGLFTMYVDGVMSTAMTSPSGPIFFSQIGESTGTGVPSFNGSLDEVRIWNIARTSSEISGAKDSELLCNESGLVAYYQFNKGTDSDVNTNATSLTDVSANGQNGMLSNFALTGTSSNWLAGSPITSLSSPPVVVSPIFYGQNATAVALTATPGLNGVSLLWYENAIGGIGSTTLIPSTTTLGSSSYYVSSVNANGCESEREKIVVNVTSPATHLNFDGVNDYVEIPSGINISNSSFTIEFNAKRTATDVVNYVLTQGVQVNNNLLHIGFRDNNNFTFAFWYNDINIPVTSYTADSEWHHWSCVYNITNGTRQVYQDGVLVGSDSGVVPYMGSGILDLGAFDGSSAFFNGNIDDVRIWNVARTLNEINTSKNCELQGTETGLIAYYKFNQGYDAGNNTTNITLTDATSNANNGTLTNFALTGTTSNWLAGSPVGVSGVITLQPQDQTVSETDPLIFTVNATGVSSYQWEYSADNGVTWSTLDDTFTDPNVSGSTTNTLTISGIGMIGITGYKFRVILDGTSMCTSTSNEVLATVTLETKSFGISNVKVYPNPSTGIFTIDIVEELEFTVYDIVGKTIINQKSLVGSNTLDLSRFEKGIYLLSLMNSKGETNTYKLIKE